jgi:hypothetical protein
MKKQWRLPESLLPSFKVFICLQHLIDQLSPEFTDTRAILTFPIVKHRKPQMKTPATDPKSQALGTVGLRQEIVRANDALDSHTLLSQTDWKLKHQPQRKFCKEIRTCSDALNFRALVLALSGSLLAKTSRKTTKCFCKVLLLLKSLSFTKVPCEKAGWD